MTKMTLFVPTKGRVDNQVTLASLPAKWLQRTIIVCPRDEVRAHMRNWKKKGVHVVQQGAEVRGIADARAWIFRDAHRQHYDKICMLDDDIRFARRARTHKLYRGIGAAPS